MVAEHPSCRAQRPPTAPITSVEWRARVESTIPPRIGDHRRRRRPQDHRPRARLTITSRAPVDDPRQVLPKHEEDNDREHRADRGHRRNEEHADHDTQQHGLPDAPQCMPAVPQRFAGALARRRIGLDRHASARETRDREFVGDFGVERRDAAGVDDVGSGRRRGRRAAPRRRGRRPGRQPCAARPWRRSSPCESRRGRRRPHRERRRRRPVGAVGVDRVGPRRAMDRALLPPRPDLFGHEGQERREQPQQDVERQPERRGRARRRRPSPYARAFTSST